MFFVQKECLYMVVSYKVDMRVVKENQNNGRWFRSLTFYQTVIHSALDSLWLF